MHKVRILSESAGTTTVVEYPHRFTRRPIVTKITPGLPDYTTRTPKAEVEFLLS